MEAVAAVVPALEATDYVLYCAYRNDVEVSDPALRQNTDPDSIFSLSSANRNGNVGTVTI